MKSIDYSVQVLLRLNQGCAWGHCSIRVWCVRCGCCGFWSSSVTIVSWAESIVASSCDMRVVAAWVTVTYCPLLSCYHGNALMTWALSIVPKPDSRQQLSSEATRNPRTGGCLYTDNDVTLLSDPVRIKIVKTSQFFARTGVYCCNFEKKWRHFVVLVVVNCD